MSAPRVLTVAELHRQGVILVEDGNHGEYRPRKEEFGVDGTSFIRAADMDAGRVLFDAAQKINSTALRRITKGVGAPGDILLSHKGTVGKVAFVPLDAPPFVCSPQTTFWRTLDVDVLDRSYLHAFLCSSAFHAQLAAFGGETDMAPYVSLTSQRAIKVQLPEIAVQRSIGRVLSTFDSKIELNRRMNETLEAMAQAIFHDWFVDFGPVRRKLAGGADPVEIMGGVTTDSARASELVRLFPDGLDHDGLPSGWQQGAARDLIEFNPREALRGGALAPYSDMASLPTRGTVADLPVMRPFGSGMRFRNGDALLARITPCLENGKGAWVDFLPHDAPVGWGSTEFIVLRGRAGTPAPFGYLLTRDPDFRRHAIQSMTGTSGRQRAQAESLETWPIALPAPPVLAAFGEHVNPLFARITAAAEEIRTLAEMRDYLLPRLMSGEVRVGGMTQEIAA